jgi:Flp pilus assembly protein TadG
MRRHRLLNTNSESGSAPLDFVFGALFVSFLVLAVIELAFSLYGRNVLASSAHEAARAAIELGGSGADGRAIAHETVERAAGGLVSDYEVQLSSERTERRVAVRVRVIGTLDPPGPISIGIPVDLSATAVRETLP